MTNLKQKIGLAQSHLPDLRRMLIRSRVAGNILAFSRSPFRKYHNVSQSVFADLSVDQAIRDLRQTGLALHLDLPENILKQIQEFTRTTRCYGGFGDEEEAKFQFFSEDRQAVEKKLGRPLILAHYRNLIKDCSAIAQVVNDPKLLAIASGYLGAEPGFIYPMLWWSYATEVSEEARLKAAQTVRYHYDEFDYKFVYYNFYLSDVDEGAGPHVCVLGSHRNKKLKHILSPANQSDREIVDSYGNDKIVTITGKAGLGFAEDAFCFHKATAPKNKDRLFFQIRVALSNHFEKKLQW